MTPGRPVALLIGVGLTLLAGARPGPDRFTARVVGVTDGDTLTVLRDRRPETVRLRGIDAPERGQPHGTRARQHLATLAFGRTVVVEAEGRDRYGRLLAEVRLPDGRSLNHALVRAGLAWWYRRYSADRALAALEAEARAARVGLWSDPDPVPPWAWRRSERPRHGGGPGGELPYLGGGTGGCESRARMLTGRGPGAHPRGIMSALLRTGGSSRIG